MPTNHNYNPDVLTCIANLSSDEVFTPPQLVNQILDQLPTERWSDKKAKSLDPTCKSGVFLREIAKRLDTGLERQIPDRQFRAEMLGDERIRKIVDFEDATEVFPGVDIAGGICCFLWVRDSHGQCEVVNMHNGTETISTRRLNEFKTFIRNSQAVPMELI